MTVPTNYILLVIATLAESVFVAAVCQGYTTESVLLSIGVLSVTVLSLFVAALFTPLTPKLAIFLIGGLIVSCLLQLVFLIVLLTMQVMSDWMIILYASLGIIGSGIYILVDLILVMCPEGIDMDDYIMGSLRLYLDIVRMFLYILMIFGKRNC